MIVILIGIRIWIKLGYIYDSWIGYSSSLSSLLWIQPYTMNPNQQIYIKLT